jgi:uroporphyrinogen decarboxylase
MTPKQRVISQIEHQETDFVPYTLGFDPGSDGADRLDEYYGTDRWRSLLDNAIHTLPWISDRFVMEWPSNKERWTDIYGNVWRLNERPWKLIQPALKEPSLKGYRLPSADECFDADWEERVVREIEAYADYFVVPIFGMGLFERIWSLRGFEQSLVDLVQHPVFYRELLDRLTDHYLEIIDRLVQLPVDAIMISDDWGYQGGITVGADRWRKLFKEPARLIYDRVHASGKYMISHSCGSLAEIIPDLIEIGLDVYESVQPEAKGNNPYELKRLYGEHLTFWGGLGSQSTIPFGTPGEIKEEVALLCREMGKGGGYILAPAKDIQPGTPVENMAAVVEAFLSQAGVDAP